MREKLKKYYYETTWGYYLLYLPKKFNSFIQAFKRNRLTDEELIQSKYQQYLGKKADLINPKTFTEKIQWLKLNDRNDLYTQCADKYFVREYIESKIGQKYLIPLLLVTENYEDITETNLPNNPFIIKTTHDSGGTFLVQDKKKTDFEVIQKEIKKRLNTNFYLLNREWEYKT